jgi:hypothetical protein
MSELHYKASNIAKAERELNANFFKTLEGLGDGTPSFNSLLMILRSGGLTEQEADDMLDTQGIAEALKTAIAALGQAGFLAVTLSESDKKKITEDHDKVVDHVTKTSPTTGVPTNL